MEVHKLYGGHVELRFDPVKHEYFVACAPDFKEVEATSVTTILKVINKPALIPWAVKKAMEVVKAKVLPGVSLDEVALEAMIKEATSAHRFKLEKAGDFGTLVHDWFERYLKAGLAKEKLPAMPVNEDMQKVIKRWMQWCKENDVKFTASEQKVYSMKYGYTGTYDAEALIGGQRCILDWKTSSGIWDEYGYQMAAYCYAKAEEQRFITKSEVDVENLYPGGMWIVRVGNADADFEVKHFPDIKGNLQAFLGAKLIHDKQSLDKSAWAAQKWEKKRSTLEDKTW